MNKTKSEDAHEDAIWSVCWANQSLVTGSLDETVKIWSAEGTPVKTFDGNFLGVVSVAFSPITNVVAASSMDSRIRFWNIDTSEQIQTINAHPGESWNINFSPDGQTLVSGSKSGNINIWSAINGEKIKSLETNGKYAMSLAYSPDGQLIASGSLDGLVTIFDATTGEKLHSLTGSAMTVRSLSFSPDSNLLFVASDDMLVRIYDVKNLKKDEQICVAVSGHASWVLSVSCGKNNEYATGSSDKKLKLWDLRKHECKATLSDHSSQVWGVAYNEESSLLASVSEDKSFVIYGVSETSQT